MRPRPNVLPLVLDSVRAQNSSLHGHDNETTPFLEEFAASATHYLQARSPGIHSIASRASIFTGHHVEEHGLVNLDDAIEPGHTIWEWLADERGYATGLFTSNQVITESSNLGDTFGTLETGEGDRWSRPFPRPTTRWTPNPGRDSEGTSAGVSTTTGRSGR